MSETDHTERLEKIYHNVPDRYQPWLKQKLNHSNEPSFKERIVELLKYFSNNTLNKIIKDENEFANNIRDSRNYYTHYDNSLYKKALKGSDLFYLTERMKVLLTCCILNKMDFNNDTIQDKQIPNNQ